MKQLDKRKAEGFMFQFQSGADFELTLLWVYDLAYYYDQIVLYEGKDWFETAQAYRDMAASVDYLLTDCGKRMVLTQEDYLQSPFYGEE